MPKLGKIVTPDSTAMIGELKKFLALYETYQQADYNIYDVFSSSQTSLFIVSIHFKNLIFAQEKFETDAQRLESDSVRVQQGLPPSTVTQEESKTGKLRYSHDSSVLVDKTGRGNSLHSKDDNDDEEDDALNPFMMSSMTFKIS